MVGTVSVSMPVFAKQDLVHQPDELHSTFLATIYRNFLQPKYKTQRNAIAASCVQVRST